MPSYRTRIAGAHDWCRIGIEGNQVRKRADGRNATSRFRVPAISEIRCESFHQRPTHHAHWANNVEGYDDDHFKLLSVGVVLSTAIVTPVFAQQAVSEPGMQAFYRSLGVGSQSSAPSAMASTRSVSYASTPAKTHFSEAQDVIGKSVPNR